MTFDEATTRLIEIARGNDGVVTAQMVESDSELAEREADRLGGGRIALAGSTNVFATSGGVRLVPVPGAPLHRSALTAPRRWSCSRATPSRRSRTWTGSSTATPPSIAACRRSASPKLGSSRAGWQASPSISARRPSSPERKRRPASRSPAGRADRQHRRLRSGRRPRGRARRRAASTSTGPGSERTRRDAVPRGESLVGAARPLRGRVRAAARPPRADDPLRLPRDPGAIRRQRGARLGQARQPGARHRERRSVCVRCCRS